jgi:hypothetical protein
MGGFVSQNNSNRQANISKKICHHMPSCVRYYGLFPINRNSSFFSPTILGSKGCKVTTRITDHTRKNFLYVILLRWRSYREFTIFWKFFYIAQIHSSIRQKKRKDFDSNLTVWKGQADVKLAVMELGLLARAKECKIFIIRSIAVCQITQGGGDLPVEREADSNS